MTTGHESAARCPLLTNQILWTNIDPVVVTGSKKLESTGGFIHGLAVDYTVDEPYALVTEGWFKSGAQHGLAMTSALHEELTILGIYERTRINFR